ncbi:ComEC/Rec2 family competence protein [Flavobacterium sp. UGB4466]|uniref:ComEC/Rec2 family competence protein n=1 Tax=Flavobacterium sp. UGB4466 TaxID=2730889 RepID=UPI00192CD273|nr:MBL fold metallo-hydrolase [Flavobacterium sp. UGB4466]
MIRDSHELTIEFFDVDGGDAMRIRYLGNDNLWHNILIDGGYIQSYDLVFKSIINSISEAGEFIDLWVITHIDLDHIGAIIGFVRDGSIKDKEKLVKSFWFNHAVFKISDLGGRIGYKQGIALRTYLEEINKLAIEQITDSTGLKDFYGLQFSILSPSNEKIEAADNDWLQKEKKSMAKMSTSKGDHYLKIEDFDNHQFVENTNIANGSSITFLVKIKGISGLFLADSHPSDIVKSLKRLNYSEKYPLETNFVKVSHHGSKNNTSPELLKLISAPLFVFTANGISNKHPDKETLVRILKNHSADRPPVEFRFVSNTAEIMRIFNVDEDAEQRYNFIQSFMAKDKIQTDLKFLPC